MKKETLLVLFLGIFISSPFVFAVTVSSFPYAQSTSSNGSTWSNIGRVTANDDSYASAGALSSNGASTDYLNLTDFRFNIPSTSVITGITVTMKRRNSFFIGSAIRDEVVSLIIGGVAIGENKASVADWTNTPTTVSYTGWSNLTNYVYSTINAVNFGVRISAYRWIVTGAATQAPEIDYVQITVTYNSTLPVELISFTGKALIDGDRQLNWSTATETNSESFILQSSKDGKNFAEVQTLSAAGNSIALKNYEFIDRNKVNDKVTYYQLIQQDFNGAQTVFPIISVTNSANSEPTIFPNPTSDFFTIDYSNNQKDEISLVQIVNSSGKIVKDYQFSNLDILDLRDQPNGIYFVRIFYTNDKNSTMIKIEKK